MRCLWLVVGVIALGGCERGPAVTAHGKPVSHWVEALQDPTAGTRRKAAQVLGNVGAVDPAVLPALTQAVNDRDATVRSEAILALLKIGPPASEAVPVLQKARNDKDPKVRSYAAKALERIQGAN